MENQHTTGFGSRMPTEECPEAIFLMCMQGIVGVILQSVMVSTAAEIIRNVGTGRDHKIMTYKSSYNKIVYI
jgi:hypothetical protein